MRAMARSEAPITCAGLCLPRLQQRPTTAWPHVQAPRRGQVLQLAAGAPGPATPAACIPPVGAQVRLHPTPKTGRRFYLLSILKFYTASAARNV